MGLSVNIFSLAVNCAWKMMFFSLSFLFIFLFSINDVASAHPGPDSTPDECVFPFRYQGVVYNSCTNANNGDEYWCGTAGYRHDKNAWIICPDVQARHVGHSHDPTTTMPTTTTKEPQGDDTCENSPCLRECGTCRRDGVCQPSCKHEGGYICVSSTGSLGKNTSFAPPSISCDLHDIQVKIVDDFFGQPDFVSNYFYISKRLDDREKCTLSRESDGNRADWSVFSINTETHSHCLEKLVNDEDVQYTSILWADLRGNGYDMPIPIISFRCEYGTDYYVGTEMQPIVGTTTTIVEDGVKLDLGIELCKISTCPHDCPSNYLVNGDSIYTVGQRVHVGIKSIGHENTVVSGHTMSLQDVYLSCSMNAESPGKRVVVFEDGCLNSGINSLFATPGNLQVHRACFSFILARLTDCRDKFYIHAYVTVCNRANRQCQDGTMTCPATRSKRSASEDAASPLVIGPLTIGEKESVVTGSFSVVQPGEPVLDALADADSYILQAKSRVANGVLTNADSYASRVANPLGSVEMDESEADANSVDVILIIGIALLIFSILLFSFLFFQSHSRYIGSSHIDGLKK